MQLVAPIEGWKYPGAQPGQDPKPDPDIDPARHGEQDVADADEYWPAAQAPVTASRPAVAQ